LFGACSHTYFVAGAAGAAGAAGTVDVTADCAAGAGACCCWHPVKANTAITARAAMIAEIFFTFFPPFLII